MNEDRIGADVDPEAQLPPEGVLGHWEAVVEDMAATAAEYRDEGWEVVELYPGDVMPLSGQQSNGDQYGIELVVPGEDARTVQNLVSAPDAAFDSCSVFRAVESGIVFLVVAVEDSDRGVAIVFPAYYDSDDVDAQEMLEAATRNGEMRTYVRDLAADAVSTFSHEDPELFYPPNEE